MVNEIPSWVPSAEEMFKATSYEAIRALIASRAPASDKVLDARLYAAERERDALKAERDRLAEDNRARIGFQRANESAATQANALFNAQIAELKKERDELRAQLAASRDGALEEAANKLSDIGFFGAAKYIRALRATPPNVEPCSRTGCTEPRVLSLLHCKVHTQAFADFLNNKRNFSESGQPIEYRTPPPVGVTEERVRSIVREEIADSVAGGDDGPLATLAARVTALEHPTPPAPGVEEVARGLHQAWLAEPPVHQQSWDDLIESDRNAYRAEARYALSLAARAGSAVKGTT